MTLTYKNAGVDIEAGEALVRQIKPAVRSTHRPEVLGAYGGFAGLCALPAGYTEPILVSGTDGVGTKLKSALETHRHDTIGQDLVAMCVNDIIVTGAEPLFFLDYYATCRLDVEVATTVITGIAQACSLAGCSLIGGETAEMPGLYKSGDYDLAGFCVGVVERQGIRNGKNLEAGDVILGLESSGLHSNGHSLARKVILETLRLDYDARPDLLEGQSVADVLLEPTRLYARLLLDLAKEVDWKAAAHITGGGLIDNPPRMLPEPTFDVHLDAKSWLCPKVFNLIATAGVAVDEMRHTFNMGLGMLVVVRPNDVSKALEVAQLNHCPASVVGELRPGQGLVRF